MVHFPNILIQPNKVYSLLIEAPCSKLRGMRSLVQFKDIYMSTDFTAQTLRQSIETLKSQRHLKDLGQNVYLVQKRVFESVADAS